ncbi:unnamed protein product [Mytilus coruscus]|uniref:Uncharacterized protein n=1 Tax=Mytilus coruscus TaxID=42192 RepID=A0A6J8BCP9_MYTCO|nr:unnamed protein product [Mytilus coruscus]
MTTDQLLKRSHADDQPLNQLQIREFKMLHGVPTDELMLQPTNQTDTWKWCRKMDDLETTTDQLLKRSHADDQPLNQLQIREFKMVHGVPTDELMLQPTKQTHGNGAGRWMTLVTRDQLMDQPINQKTNRYVVEFLSHHKTHQRRLQINYSKRSHADDQPLNQLQIREFKMVHGVPTDELMLQPTKQTHGNGAGRWMTLLLNFVSPQTPPETTTDQLLKRSHADDQPLNQLQIREFKMVHGVPTDKLMLQTNQKQTHGNGAGRWMTLVTRDQLMDQPINQKKTDMVCDV